MSEFNLDEAKKVLEEGTAKAKEIIDDPSKIDALLQELEEKLKEVPKAGDVLSKVPLMIAMVKAYVTKEYTDISPKVILTMVGSFLYFLKRKDFIPDNIPVLGQLDDIAVFAAALTANEKELSAFREWRDAKNA